jgi:adenylate kinase
MILIFFGPPGAGKGTQAKFVSNKLNIFHLSTGDVLREQLKKKNNLSFELKKIIKSGQLVSDTTLNQMVLFLTAIQEHFLKPIL